MRGRAERRGRVAALVGVASVAVA